MSTFIRASLTLTVLSFTLAGCGTIFGGTTENIQVQSSPQGARVTTRPEVGAASTTPTVLELQRKNSYTLVVTREGYEPGEFSIKRGMRGGILALDILFTGLIGVVVDAATGGWYNLDPDAASVTLTRSEGNDEGPETIEVHLSIEDGVARIESSEPVEVQIEK